MKNLLTLVCLFLVASGFFACWPNPVGGTLENTWWVLASMQQGNKTLTPSGGDTITLHFEAGRLNGQGPCNSYFAGYTIQGTGIRLENMGATKRMCEAIEQEDLYFDLLSGAKSYSVLKDHLEVFCEKGRLRFSPMKDSEVSEWKFKNGTGRLATLFSPIDSSTTPHLFPILQVDNPDGYPYKGMPIDTALYKYFDTNSSSVWLETGGEVMAVGQFGDFFICRVPGRYVSSDIALYRIVNGLMTHTETVAWAWCDEGWCNQQDAWLTDVNQDGRLDLVQHYTLTDDRGKIREERVTASLQDEGGNFVENRDIHLDKSKFAMAKI